MRKREFVVGCFRLCVDEDCFIVNGLRYKIFNNELEAFAFLLRVVAELCHLLDFFNKLEYYDLNIVRSKVNRTISRVLYECVRNKRKIEKLYKCINIELTQ